MAGSGRAEAIQYRGTCEALPIRMASGQRLCISGRNGGDAGASGSLDMPENVGWLPGWLQ